MISKFSPQAWALCSPAIYIFISNDVFVQRPRFKSFGSGRNSLNPALRPNLKPNSDDSLFHVIDGFETLVGFSEE